MDDLLKFQLEVIILQVDGLKSVSAKRIIYCTMEVEGEGKFQTDHVEASSPMWNTQGDFTLTHPLPTVKLKLYMENSGMLALDDKELGKLVLKPTPYSPQGAEWHTMTVPKSSIDRDLKIKVICKMESPPRMKHCGDLYAIGKIAWKKWKKRYHVIYEVPGNMYRMRSFKDKKSDVVESVLLDGYTVDYIEPEKAKLMVGMSLKGGQYFFSAVKEGDNLLLATDDEKECRAWVTAIYKATGQPNKPVFPHATNATTSKAIANQKIENSCANNTPKIVKR